MQYRQGDVWIEQIDEIPANAKEIKRENGAVVLAHGEATGHCHAIKSRSAKFLEAGGERFLQLAEPCALEHQEHAPIELPLGSYKVIRQVEYSPEAVRNVAD